MIGRMKFWENIIHLIFLWSQLLAASVSWRITLVDINLNLVEQWLFHHPNSTFYIFHTKHKDIIQGFIELGYDIHYEELKPFLEKCEVPENPVLCVAQIYKGIVVGADIDPAEVSWPILVEARDQGRAVFLKSRIEPRPWCINGFFQVETSFMYLPENEQFIDDTSKMIRSGAPAVEALTRSVRRLLRNASLIEPKIKPISLRIRKRIGAISSQSFHSALSENFGLDGVFRLHHDTPTNINIKTTSGTLICGDASGKVMEHEARSVAGANRWLTSCRLVGIREPATKVSLHVNGDTVSCTVYMLASLVTVVIKTFGRMDKALQLVDSINKHHPGVRVVLGDDGKDSGLMDQGEKRGFYYVPLPYDTGLSQGRNHLVKLVSTPYVLFLDDDFTVSEPDSLLLLMHELMSGAHDIVAAKSPRCDTDYSGMMHILRNRKRGNKVVISPRRDLVLGSLCHRVDIVPNLFLAPSELFQSKGLRWNPKLKLGEHEEFFLRVKQRHLRVATCPDASFDHWQIPPDQQAGEYRRMRDRVWLFLEQFLRDNGLTELVAFGRSKARIHALPRVKRLAQSPAVFPFSAYLQIDTDSEPISRALLEVYEGKNKTSVAVHEMLNPARLTRIDLPLSNLEPGKIYHVRIKPANMTSVDESGPEIKIHTVPYRSYNLLRNPSFDGSTRAWRASLGSKLGLIPLFFPNHEKNFERKKIMGHFHEHISGRPSAWAARKSRRRMDRNYACFLMAPPMTSFSRAHPVHTVTQNVPIKNLPLDCREENGRSCLLLASAWVRVDKLWGERATNRLFLSVRFLRMDGELLQEHKQELNPSLLDTWQYAVIQHNFASLPRSVATLQFSVELNAQMGSIYVDDAYLAMRPFYQEQHL